MSKSDQPAGVAVDRGVRPSLLTEKELLDIVDSLIRDRAFNRPAAVAIAMAVGDAVEAEVRERCAKLCEDISDEYQCREGAKYHELRTDAQDGASKCAAAIRGA